MLRVWLQSCYWKFLPSVNWISVTNNNTNIHIYFLYDLCVIYSLYHKMTIQKKIFFARTYYELNMTIWHKDSKYCEASKSFFSSFEYQIYLWWYSLYHNRNLDVWILSELLPMDEYSDLIILSLEQVAQVILLLENPFQ